jgi:hypothetical protein
MRATEQKAAMRVPFGSINGSIGWPESPNNILGVNIPQINLAVLATPDHQSLTRAKSCPHKVLARVLVPLVTPQRLT